MVTRKMTTFLYNRLNVTITKETRLSVLLS